MYETHLALHGVAVKKHGSAAAVAEITGLAPARVEQLLGAAVERGRAARVKDKYLLTAAGRLIVESEYSRFYDAARADKAFVAAHQRFEVVNNELKQVITDWQTMSVGGKKVANDHSDADYDDKIIDRLGQVDEKIEPILKIFAATVPRFSTYRNKLETALEHAEDGEVAWVSDVNIDSYHTVWFEMHEDILRVLGRQREE